MRARHLSLVLAASFAVVAASSTAHADLVVNGGFELTPTGTLANQSPTGPTSAATASTAGSFYGWAISDTTDYEIVEPSSPLPGGYGYYVAAGAYAAQLGTTSLSTLTQTIADTVGQEYDLTFELRGDNSGAGNTASNSFSAAIGSDALTTVLNDASTGFVLYSFDFTGTGSDVLKFTSEDQDDFLALDSVSINAVPAVSSVPEPSSLMLLGTGVLGLAAAARRKFVSV